MTSLKTHVKLKLNFQDFRLNYSSKLKNDIIHRYIINTGYHFFYYHSTSKTTL